VTTSVRWAGVCLILAGLLTLPVVTHPNILDIGLAEAALTLLWTAVHASGLAVVMLSLAGVAGLALLHGTTWGRLGTVAVVLTLVGLVATAGLSAIEAFAFPAVARNDPGLLDFDGPIAGTAAFWILGGLASLWLLGEALLGISIARAGVLSRAPAVALTVGALSFAAFEGPFVPVLGQVSVVLFALGQMWLGVELVRARQSVSGASPAPPGSRSNAEMR
jgi:hypothetical protein